MTDENNDPGILNLGHLPSVLPKQYHQGFINAIESINIDLVHDTRKSTLLLFREQIDEVKGTLKRINTFSIQDLKQSVKTKNDKIK